MSLRDLMGSKIPSPMQEKDYFPFDADVTDLALIVEEKKLHVSKVVLMDASPVFRKMFTGDFKEKGATELELPGKKYSTFVLFLRCIFPREYVKITESLVGDLLPLAHEYDVKCVLSECETFLMTDIELKKAKAASHYAGEDKNVEYFLKCLYYGTEYGLNELYGKAFQSVIPYKLSRYAKTKFYELLPEKNKRDLLESRLLRIERAGKSTNETFTPKQKRGVFMIEESTTVFQCPNNLFL